MKTFKERIISITSGIALTFALSFMLCVYAPYELFLTNQSEFWFDAGIMVIPTLMFFFGSFILGTAVFYLLKMWGDRQYKIGLAAGLVMLISSYVQGNYFTSGLPPLDGTNFEWSAPSPERIKSILIIVVSIALCTFLLIKFGKTLFTKLVFYVSGGLSKMDAIKKAAKDRGVQKNVIYKQICG